MGNQYSKIDEMNSLEINFPKIAKEWDYSKNSFKPSEVTYGSEKKVWWLCDKQHSYFQRIADSTPPKTMVAHTVQIKKLAMVTT